MLRWLTAGESHGPALMAVLEGLPAGVSTTTSDVADELARRRLGHGRGARMAFERDEVEFLGGVRHGTTQGGPVAVRVGNTEWPKWSTVMSADPVDAEELAGLARNAPLTRPRPGHADLVGMQKYGFDDARPVLERASARETAARVALGSVAKAFLRQTCGIEVLSHVTSIGAAEVAPGSPLPTPADLDAVDASPVRVFDAASSDRLVDEVDAAHKAGDTLGGIVEVLAYGVPPGLGSHVHWDRRIDARLAFNLMGIQAIKGVEVGDGFDAARKRGSQVMDEIVRGDDGLERTSGNLGGTEGGMTSGEVLRVRAAMKPISTVPRALKTIDTTTGEAAVAHHQRSDVCAVPAAGVVAEAMVALVLADAVLEKFGGDSVEETRRNHDAYLAALDRPVSRPVLVLVGPPGAGKSTVGRAVADRLGVGFRDTDADVEALAGKTVPEVFFDDGEPRFRELEQQAVATALDEHDGVLSLGGGAVLAEPTRALLPGHVVVLLDVDLPSAAQRVGLGQGRPLVGLNPRAQLRQLLQDRRPVYEAVATHVVDTSGRPVEQVVDDVVALASRP